MAYGLKVTMKALKNNEFTLVDADVNQETGKAILFFERKKNGDTQRVGVWVQDDNTDHVLIDGECPEIWGKTKLPILNALKSPLHHKLTAWDGHSKRGQAIYEAIFEQEKIIDSLNECTHGGPQCICPGGCQNW